MEQYRYSPLSEPRSFRVLYLRGPLYDGPVQGELREANIDTCPEYEALSYTWESQTPSVQIICDGRALLVTMNCETALRRLLRGRLNRPVWVDSVCINQDLVAERNQQVRLMGEIYRKAARVNVWLGPSTETTDAAISNLKKTAVSALIAMVPGPFLGWRRGRHEKRVANLQAEEAHHTGSLPYGQIGSIFTRPWFRRLWVVQEVAMSRSNAVMFYCGDQMIRFELLFTAVDYSNIPNMPPSQRHWFSYLAVPRMLKDAVAFQYEGKPLPVGLTLSAMLATTIWREATDPKDKIFGFYGIAQYLGWPLPEPDYEKPIYQIYTEAARCAIQHDNTLELLESVPGSTHIENLPSWVPDFSQLPSSIFKRSATFAAAGATNLQFYFTESGRRLSLLGRFIDVIDVRGSSLVWGWENTIYKGSMPSPGMVQEAGQTIRQWVHIAQRLPAYLNGEPVSHAFARTLLMDGLRDRNTAQILQLYPEFHSVLTEGDVQLSFANELPHDVLDPEGRKAYMQTATFQAMVEHAIMTNLGRTLVLTAGGMMGTASDLVQLGDIVVIFSGSKVPSILREQGDNFLFLGPAYVHGAMDGELWTDDQSDLHEFSLV